MRFGENAMTQLFPDGTLHSHCAPCVVGSSTVLELKIRLGFHANLVYTFDLYIQFCHCWCLGAKQLAQRMVYASPHFSTWTTILCFCLGLHLLLGLLLSLRLRSTSQL